MSTSSHKWFSLLLALFLWGLVIFGATLIFIKPVPEEGITVYAKPYNDPTPNWMLAKPGENPSDADLDELKHDWWWYSLPQEKKSEIFLNTK